MLLILLTPLPLPPTTGAGTEEALQGQLQGLAKSYTNSR